MMMFQEYDLIFLLLYLQYLRAVAPKRKVIHQPQVYYRSMKNTFNLLIGEKVFRYWRYTDHSCCCKNSYDTVLTNVRLLTRYKYTCCNGCSESSHTDSTVFLRDIDQIRESRDEDIDCFCFTWIGLLCLWPCYLIRRICCPKPKCLEISGTFGSELIRLNQQDMSTAQVDLSTVIIHNKNIAKY